MNWGLRRRWPFTPSTGNCLHCCLLCKRGVSLQPVSAVSYTSETLVILVTRETVWYCTWLILVCLSCLVAGRFWFVAFDLSKVSQYGLSVAKIMLCDGKLYECINRPSNRNSFHWNGNGNSLMVSDVGRTHTHTHTDTHTHTHSQTHMQICWRFMVFLQTFAEPLPLSFLIVLANDDQESHWNYAPCLAYSLSEYQPGLSGFHISAVFWTY